jgi:hypothetical protein
MVANGLNEHATDARRGVWLAGVVSQCRPQRRRRVESCAGFLEGKPTAVIEKLAFCGAKQIADGHERQAGVSGPLLATAARNDQ